MSAVPRAVGGRPRLAASRQACPPILPGGVAGRLAGAARPSAEPSIDRRARGGQNYIPSRGGQNFMKKKEIKTKINITTSDYT